MDQREAAIIMLRSRGYQVALSKKGSYPDHVFYADITRPDGFAIRTTRHYSIYDLNHRLIQLAQG